MKTKEILIHFIELQFESNCMQSKESNSLDHVHNTNVRLFLNLQDSGPSFENVPFTMVASTIICLNLVILQKKFPCLKYYESPIVYAHKTVG